MNIDIALRRAALAVLATGSLTPGMAAPPPGPPPSPVSGLHVASTQGSSQAGSSALRRTWSWPLNPRPRVVTAFVAPRSTYGRGHRGIDLAASQGQPVHAVDAGTVTHVGVVAGRGTVTIAHTSGLISTYEPVRGSVVRGAAVARGQAIGLVSGRSHCGSDCLHLGAPWRGAYADPRPLLPANRIVLMPLASPR